MCYRDGYIFTHVLRFIHLATSTAVTLVYIVHTNMAYSTYPTTVNYSSFYSPGVCFSSDDLTNGVHVLPKPKLPSFIHHKHTPRKTIIDKNLGTYFEYGRTRLQFSIDNSVASEIRNKKSSNILFKTENKTPPPTVSATTTVHHPLCLFYTTRSGI